MNLLEIKTNRLSEPEIFLLDILDGLEEYVNDNYHGIIFYVKDDMVMFEYCESRRIFRYSYENIRIYLRDDFNIKYQESITLIQSIVIKHLNLNTIPQIIGFNRLIRIDSDFVIFR